MDRRRREDWLERRNICFCLCDPLLGLNTGRIIRRNPGKSFPPSYSQSPILSLRFLFLQTHATSYSFLTQPLVKEKGGKPDRKPYPLSNGLVNLYRNLKSENSQDNAQKPLNDNVCSWIRPLFRISWNDNAPRFSMRNNLADQDTAEGYMLQAFIGEHAL